jgi:hypothetical protein
VRALGVPTHEDHGFREARATSRTAHCVPICIKLNRECAIANILKGRGRAVAALWGALHSTLTTDCGESRHRSSSFDGLRQRAPGAPPRHHRQPSSHHHDRRRQ